MDVGEFLRRLGLEQYEPAFRANAIDDAVLPSLTADDLRDLGVALIGHRRRILDAAQRLDAPVAADAPAPAGAERRQVTVMFCDLVGSTALATRLDPEDLRAVIGAYHGAVAATVARFHGFVAQYLGDGVLVYFGYPEAREDDAAQAVRSALALAASLPALAPRPGIALDARFGIATGLVVVGDLVGTEPKIAGETPNLAARLQALAAPNAVVIAESTNRLVAGLFVCDDLGAVELKGFAEPQRAWRVAGERRSEGRFEASHADLSPLVGRDEELDLLLRRWQQIKTGAGRVVVLSGEPGIGKSRLVSALRDRIAAEPQRRVSHFCAPHRQESALFPIIEQLERAAGFEREDDAAAKLDKLASLLDLSGVSSGESAALVAALLSLPGDGRFPPLNLTPQQHKSRTLQALVALLAGLAAREPVLATFEDLHWIDPTSRELLDLIVDRVPSLRVLLVLTCRPEFVPPWTGRAQVSVVALNRLGSHEGEAMLAASAGNKMLPPEVAAQIIARTDGVPLFIEELTKAVIESGLMRDAGDRYVLDGPLPPLAIPTTLQSSLMARLDRLAPAREVAQIGAAIGRQFPHGLLSAVARISEERLADALKRLADASLIFVRGTPPDADYTFKHALVQDAAYATLVRERRQELHARIAAALERDAGAEPELVAHHLAEAGEIARAVPLWLAAGRRDAARSANAEAIAHFNRGIAAVQTLPDTTARARQELALQLALGPCLLGLWKLAEAKRAFERVQALCEALGDQHGRFRATWGLWLSSFAAQWNPETPAKLVTDLFAIAGALDDDALRLQAHHAAWPTRMQTGDIKAAWEHVERGLAIYDPDKHRDHATTYGGHDPGVCGMGFGSGCLWLLGYPERSAHILAQAQALAGRLGHLPTFAASFPQWAPLQAYAGRDLDAVQQDGERIAAIGIELGIGWNVEVGTVLRGWVHAQRGDADGVGEMRRGFDAMIGGAVTFTLPFCRLLIAESHRRRGAVEAGLDVIKNDPRIDDDIFTGFVRAEYLRLEGEFRLLAGERAPAERCFLEALEIARQRQTKSLELRAAMSLARLWRADGKDDAARTLLASVYGWFSEGFATPDLIEAKALIDQLG